MVGMSGGGGQLRNEAQPTKPAVSEGSIALKDIVRHGPQGQLPLRGCSWNPSSKTWSFVEIATKAGEQFSMRLMRRPDVVAMKPINFVSCPHHLPSVALSACLSLPPRPSSCPPTSSPCPSSPCPPSFLLSLLISSWASVLRPPSSSLSPLHTDTACRTLQACPYTEQFPRAYYDKYMKIWPDLCLAVQVSSTHKASTTS